MPSGPLQCFGSQHCSRGWPPPWCSRSSHPCSCRQGHLVLRPEHRSVDVGSVCLCLQMFPSRRLQGQTHRMRPAVISYLNLFEHFHLVVRLFWEVFPVANDVAELAWVFSEHVPNLAAGVCSVFTCFDPSIGRLVQKDFPIRHNFKLRGLQKMNFSYSFAISPVLQMDQIWHLDFENRFLSNIVKCVRVMSKT